MEFLCNMQPVFFVCSELCQEAFRVHSPGQQLWVCADALPCKSNSPGKTGLGLQYLHTARSVNRAGQMQNDAKRCKTRRNLPSS